MEENRGAAILSFLRVAVTELKAELRELWDKAIPRLLQTLTDDEDNGKSNKKFDLANWQDLILKVSFARRLVCPIHCYFVVVSLIVVLVENLGFS